MPVLLKYRLWKWQEAKIVYKRTKYFYSTFNFDGLIEVIKDKIKPENDMQCHGASITLCK